MLVLALGTVAVVFVFVGARSFKNTLVSDYTNMAQGTAKLAADLIDGDKVDEYLEKKRFSDGYLATEQLLEKILSRSPEVKFLYAYKIREDGFQVVFDINTDDVQADEVGSIVSYDEEFADYIPDLLAGKEIDPIVVNDKYGYLMACYQPVYDSQGRCVCYVGADVNMEGLSAYERSFSSCFVLLWPGSLITTLSSL